MKYLWPLAALLCIDAASAETLLGKYIQRADRPICNPHAAQPVADGWSLALALPRDCAVVSVRNPVFTWTRKKGLRWDFYTATFELRDASNNIVYSTTTPDTRLILPQDLPLSSYAAGSNAVYSWTVSYTDYDGTVFKSAPRRFTIRSGAEYIATEAQIVEAAKGRVHPRALTRSGPANQIYDVYANQIARGDRSVELSAALAVTRAEMDHSSAYWPDTDDKLGENVANERRAIETLGHLYFILRNNSPAQALVYLEKCRARLLALKDWPNDPTALTHQAHNDQANREAFLALALGWDIFKAQEVKALGENYSLSGQQLDDIKRVALERIGLAIEGAGSKVGFKSLRTAPFNSHVISATHYATEALMYLVDPADTIDEKDNPQGTASRLAWSWRTMVTSVGTWGGTSDGGFGNGSNYAWYSMGKNARTLAAVKLITGRNLTEFAPIGAIGMNIVAQTPPAEGTHFHHQMGTFGDGAEIDDHMMNYGGSDFRLLAYASELPIYEWYWRTSPSVTAPQKSVLPYAFLTAARETDGSQPQLAVPDSFLFEDAGYVAFHSDTTKPDRTSLYFRSSPQGTASHGAADNNAFVFVSQGEDILINSGFYGSWTHEHFAQWTRHTMSKNALTMQLASGRSGVGQSQHFKDGVFQNTIYDSAESKGKLVNYYAGTGADRWRIATGDATAAYRYFDEGTGAWQPLLDSAIRTVAYLKGATDNDPAVVFIYDYAHSEQPRTWELNFHSLTAPVVTGNSIRIKTANRRTGAEFFTCIDYHGPKGSFTGITKLPDTKDIPEPMPSNYVVTQWHTRFRQSAESKYFYALTVIRENCPADPMARSPVGVSLPKNARIEATVDGKNIVFNQGRVDF